jgi:hypothetical protein
MMPGLGCDSYEVNVARMKAAIAKAKRKFPDLIEGSSGWHRAINAYYK